MRTGTVRQPLLPPRANRMWRQSLPLVLGPQGGEAVGGWFSQPLCDLCSAQGTEGEDQEEDHFSFLSSTKVY